MGTVLTLVDVQRLKKTAFEKGVIEVFLRGADITKVLPFETIGTVEAFDRVTDSIPTVGFRKRGEQFGPVAGGGETVVSDATFPMGATIDIDITDVRDKALTENPLALRTREAVTALAWTFNDTFVNGDHGVDEDAFEGIKVRIATLPASQTVYANTPTTPLDLVTAINSNDTATMHKFLDKIDEAIYACDGRQADVCITDADAISMLKKVLRRLAFAKVDYEPFYPSDGTGGQNKRRTSALPDNRPVFRYNGVDFYDMGLKANQVDPIVGTRTIGGVATRPMYFLKLGRPYFWGIQQYPMDIRGPRELDDGVTVRTVIDWPVGLRHVHRFSGSVLLGAKVS